MIRIASLTLFVAATALLAADSARAQLPVAPPPREVKPDGSRPPVPAPETPAKAEDPAVIVDRIIKNSKDVGDRLEKTDTGTDTQKKQGKVLSDIDALINREENPPPPQPDQNKDKNDKQDDKKDMKDPKNDMNMKDMPPPKSGDMPMDKKDMGMGKDGMPIDKMGDPPPMPMGGTGRKPRMNDPMGGEKKEQDKNDPKPDPMNPKKKPGDGSKEPKDKNSGAAGGKPGGKPLPKVSLPFDEDVAKDVWGHLPDKLRQQMTQYYREDAMPKYGELLRLYYSSLAERTPATMPPK